MSPETLEIISHVGFTIDFIGKILVSYTAISVHLRVWKEHSIDDVVFNEMRRERTLGLLGVGLMIGGYAMEIFARILL